jgi:hypothetical protein
VVLTTDGSVEAGKKAPAAAEQLAKFFWDAKESFLPTQGTDGSSSLLGHVEAVARAHATIMEAEAEEPQLVVLGDGANATSAGAPGDSGHLLAAMLEHEWPPDRPAVVAYVAPRTVLAARAVGQGGNTCVISPHGCNAGMTDSGCQLTDLGSWVPIMVMSWSRHARDWGDCGRAIGYRVRDRGGASRSVGDFHFPRKV